MPVYAYKCKNCGHQFDVRQSFTDDPIKHCVECGGDVRKQFNSVGVVFKGSGFYRTDSRSGSGDAQRSGGSAGGASETKKSTSDASASASSSSAPAGSSAQASSSSSGSSSTSAPSA